MKLVSKAFRRTDWYVTSPYGKRKDPITGKTSTHWGTDYGTHCKKWPLYAIEDGYVQLVTKSNSGYGNHIWIRYPRINLSLMYAHMDSIKLKKGDKVKEGTLVGYTGTTGRSTGIHLHLGMTKIGSDTWLNPHSYDYIPPEEPKPTPTPEPPEPTPTTGFKVGDKVVPTKLVDYNGRHLRQYDSYYYITELVKDRAVLKAKRGNKYYTWAAMNTANIKKI